MKRIISIFVALVVAAFAAAPQAADDYLAALIGPQAKIIDSLQRLSRDKDYRAIYRLLGRDYTSDITEEYFVTTSQKLSWTFAKLDYGTLDANYHFAWMPVRGIVKLASNREVRFDTVVFFGRSRRVEADDVSFLEVARFAASRRRSTLARCGRQGVFERLKKPNQTPEPTTLLVTPRAFARVAPSRVVAHL